MSYINYYYNSMIATSAARSCQPKLRSADSGRLLKPSSDVYPGPIGIKVNIQSHRNALGGS
jgi:hypothetical protein